MASVTQRVKEIKQPYGGYLPMKCFEKTVLDDGKKLYEGENIPAGLVGTAVDYLTRLMLGKSAEEAFRISLMGADIIGKKYYANKLVKKVKSLSDESIIAACKLSGYDVCVRAGTSAYKPVENIMPNEATISNVRTMVERSLYFFEQYGEPTESKLTFEGGYTDTVDSGDGDFLTTDTLWDFKVSKNAPTSKHTLQILMYYLMGMHSIHQEYQTLKNLGFFNPRLNTVYICKISKIPKDVCLTVENEVICYGNNRKSVDLVTRKNTLYDSKLNVDSYTVAELSDVLNVSRQSIYKEIRRGRINASKIGNKYVVSQTALDDYVMLRKKEHKRQVIFTLIEVVLIVLLFLWLFSRFL